MKPIYLGLILFLFFAESQGQNIDSVSSQKKIKPWFVEKFVLSAGFFLPINNTNVQVGINGTAHGTDIDFETDLGYNKSIGTFLANFQWRISPRSRVSLSYYIINRSSQHILDKDIIFKEDTFPVNGSVSSYFNTAIYQVSYGYAIFSKPRYEAGLMIGAHLVGGKTGFALNNATNGVSKNTSFGFTAPLPDLGIWGGYAISKRLAINFELNYLSLTFGNYTGSILAYNLLLKYKIIDNLNISIGYTGLNCKLEITKENAQGRFKWGYNGPTFAASFSFGNKSWTH